jgi:hypothetical protein
MPRPDPTTIATHASRSAGGLARAAKLREQRELANDQVLDALDRALARLVELLESDDEQVALRAAVQVLDRALGRPRQPLEHSGVDGAAIEIHLADAHEKLAKLLARRRSRSDAATAAASNCASFTLNG